MFSIMVKGFEVDKFPVIIIVSQVHDLFDVMFYLSVCLTLSNK